MINKKKRIIAKCANGDPGFFEKVGNSLKNFGQGVADKFKGVNTGDVMGAAAGASQGIASSMGIEQGKAGQVISGIGSVVSMIPGWGQIAGPAIQMLGNFTGGGGSVDENTGEVQKSSGLTRLFGWGRSDASLFRKSNRIKNTKVAKAQTENIQAEYYNDPNVEVQPNVLAAEGGIMRRPVDALVSKGELIYDPTTKELMKVPGSKGKPNKKDDVPIRLYEGDVVLSNSPTMLMANGKTPAQNVERFINKKSKSSDGTVKAREAIIKKVVNWQEANKTKPQQYAMYDEGTPSAKEMRIATRQKERPFEGAKYVAMSDDRAKRYSDPDFINHLSSYLGHKENVDLAYEQLKDLPQVKSAMIKFDNDKQKALQHLTSDGKYGNVMHYFYNDYINKRNLPAIDFKPYTLNYAKIENGPIKIPKLKLTPPAGDKDGSGNKTNLGDLAYKAASILTPLLDHAEPEAVNYEIANVDFIPVNVNELDKLRAINENYSLDLYNASKMNTNTGQWLAYASQSATNRMKQISDVYSWKTNAQNQLIGKNIDAYNKWSADYANTMNSVYDKVAANRAAARNINRQNMATALKNWGQILKDDKQYANERIKTEALTPLMKYAYENDEKLRSMIIERLGGNV